MMSDIELLFPIKCPCCGATLPREHKIARKIATIVFETITNTLKKGTTAIEKAFEKPRIDKEESNGA